MMNKMYKKGMVILAAAAMTLTAAIGVSAEGYHGNQYCVAEDGLCVRVSPDVSSQQVGSYYYGQDVDVIDPIDYNGWTKVAYDGMQRYVCSAYLSASQPTCDYSWSETDYNGATRTGNSQVLSVSYHAGRIVYEYTDGTWRDEYGNIFELTEDGSWSCGDGESYYNKDFCIPIYSRDGSCINMYKDRNTGEHYDLYGNTYTYSSWGDFIACSNGSVWYSYPWGE